MRSPGAEVIRERVHARIEAKKRSTGDSARCEACGRGGGKIVLRERLDPRNLRPERQRLCTECGVARGYVAVEWRRAAPCE